MRCDGYSKRAAHRSAQRLPPIRIGCSLAGNDSRHAAGFAGANDGSDVARILDVAQHEDQLRLFFERGFEWWERSDNGTEPLIRLQLPFENGRSDLLTGNGSRLDIENINLLATLLIHAEHQGYWSKLGEQFEEDMQSLLDQHLLAGLVNAPWVRTGDAESADDTKFFSALQELVAYVFEESVRVRKRSGILFSRSHEVPARSSGGILHEMQSLLQKYRTEVVRRSHLDDKGDRT